MNVDPRELRTWGSAVHGNPISDIEWWVEAYRINHGHEPTRMLIAPAQAAVLHRWEITTFGPFHKQWPLFNDVVAPRVTRLVRWVMRKRSERRWRRLDREESW